MSPKELAIMVNAFAINLAEGHTDEEVAALSAVFMQIGDTLSLLSAQKQLIESKKSLLCQNKLSKRITSAISPQQDKDT